jgi:hypothetical protein
VVTCVFSHSVRRIIGEIICGFSSPLINELIDGYVRVNVLDEKVQSSGALYFDLIDEPH